MKIFKNTLKLILLVLGIFIISCGCVFGVSKYKRNKLSDTELSIQNLNWLKSYNSLPDNYEYSVWTNDGKLITNNVHIIKNTDHEIYSPIENYITSETFNISGIEDNMIYTVTDVVLDGKEQGQILYINDPNDKYKFVAISVMMPEYYILYSYNYKGDN